MPTGNLAVRRYDELNYKVGRIVFLFPCEESSRLPDLFRECQHTFREQSRGLLVVVGEAAVGE